MGPPRQFLFLDLNICAGCIVHWDFPVFLVILVGVGVGILPPQIRDSRRCVCLYLLEFSGFMVGDRPLS